MFIKTVSHHFQNKKQCPKYVNLMNFDPTPLPKKKEEPLLVKLYLFSTSIFKITQLKQKTASLFILIWFEKNKFVPNNNKTTKQTTEYKKREKTG